MIKEIYEIKEISVLKTQPIDKFQRLDSCQSQVLEILLQDKDEKQFTENFEGAEEYQENM